MIEFDTDFYERHGIKTCFSPIKDIKPGHYLYDKIRIKGSIISPSYYYYDNNFYILMDIRYDHYSIPHFSQTFRQIENINKINYLRKRINKNKITNRSELLDFN